MDQGIPKCATVVYYEPRSDFINLTKLGRLVLIKKQEENKEEESPATATLQGWIWEKMVKIGENKSLGTSFKITCKSMSKRRIDMTIQKEKYIMGITAESTAMTSTMLNHWQKKNGNRLQ